MKKIIILVLFTLILSGCSLLDNKSVLKPEEARVMIESFINENIVAPGNEITITEISEEYGLYKLIIGFGEGQQSESYLTKDGKLLFPQVINVEEVKQTVQEQLDNANTLPEGQSSNMTQVEIETLTEGTGDAVTELGDVLEVHYTGWLTDGTKFDSSVDRDQTFNFTIGAGQVIQGWDQGLIGMKVGEKRKLTIPPELGYGQSGSGSLIPPNSTLIFEVELISIE